VSEHKTSAFVAALLVWVAVTANAATPEQDYLASRDKYIAKFTPLRTDKGFTDDVSDEHKRALADLEKMLRRVIGPVALKGFSAESSINLDGLVTGDEGFGLLDALVYPASEGEGDQIARVTVTTNTLLDRWLREHKNWWGPTSNNVPQNVVAALKSEAFYTQAISTDSAVSRYAEIPVTKPGSAKFSYAMLAIRTQTDGPQVPDELIISVAHATRLYIVTAPIAVTIAPIAACEEIWKEYVRKSEEALEAFRESQVENPDESSHFDKIRDQGDAAFHRCYAQRAKDQPFFAALIKEAQALVARLPPK
jgi:hypothetical protein